MVVSYNGYRWKNGLMITYLLTYLYRLSYSKSRDAIASKSKEKNFELLAFSFCRRNIRLIKNFEISTLKVMQGLMY